MKLKNKIKYILLGVVLGLIVGAVAMAAMVSFCCMPESSHIHARRATLFCQNSLISHLFFPCENHNYPFVKCKKIHFRLDL